MQIKWSSTFRLQVKNFLNNSSNRTIQAKPQTLQAVGS